MKRFESQRLLMRVYLRNIDKFRWVSAATMLADRALKNGLAGVTVLRGILGVDVAGKLLQSSRWSVVRPAPVVLELVDQAEILGRFLFAIEEVAPEGIVTVQEVTARTYASSDSAAVSRHERRQSLTGRFWDYFWTDELLVRPAVESGMLLRVFTGMHETLEGEPLYYAIVKEACDLKLAGAAAFQAILGLGSARRLPQSKWSNRDWPVVVEIVDSPRGVAKILPFLDKCMFKGIATLEEITLLKYSRDSNRFVC